MSDDLNFERAQYTPEPFDPQPASNVPRAVLFGLGAAILASVLYAAFTVISRLEFGIVAVAVGYMVGKAMMLGANGHGSRNLQIASAILTYLSVSFASVPELLWTLHKRGMDVGHVTPHVLFILTRYGLISPFMGLTHGINGVLGLVILFIGIRAAWRLTSPSVRTAHHPFTAS